MSNIKERIEFTIRDLEDSVKEYENVIEHSKIEIKRIKERIAIEKKMLRGIQMSPRKRFD